MGEHKAGRDNGEKQEALFIGWPRGRLLGGAVTSEQRPEMRELARLALGGKAFGQKERQVGGPRGQRMPRELREHQGDPSSKMPLLGKGLSFDSFLCFIPTPHLSASPVSSLPKYL